MLFMCLFVVLGTEPRAWQTLGKHTPKDVYPQNAFAPFAIRFVQRNILNPKMHKRSQDL